MRGSTAIAGLAALLAGCTAGQGAGGGAGPGSWAATFVPAPAARPTEGIALPVGKCVNLGNMLEPPTEAGWGGRPFEDADAARIRARGFSSVRLPVRFSGHALDAPPYTIDPAFMARVRHVVEANLDAGLNVLVELHAFDEMYADPAANRDRLAGLWRQIAAEFRTAPDGLWFELINEPRDRLDRSNLLEMLAPALAAVRETNPTRPVIIGGDNWSGVDSLAALELPDDPYVVPTFHYYEPFDFTHQGAGWVTPPPAVTGRDFGSEADRAQLAATLDKVRAYMARTGRVPFVGEYGAYERIRTRQRADYYHTISAAFASIGVQSCAWAYVNTFPLWRDRSGWIEPIVGGIVTTTGD